MKYSVKFECPYCGQSYELDGNDLLELSMTNVKCVTCSRDFELNENRKISPSEKTCKINKPIFTETSTTQCTWKTYQWVYVILGLFAGEFGAHWFYAKFHERAILSIFFYCLLAVGYVFRVYLCNEYS